MLLNFVHILNKKKDFVLDIHLFGKVAKNFFLEFYLNT